MSLEGRIVEMAVVHPGDSVLIRVQNDMPLDPYSDVSAEEQLQSFAERIQRRLGEGVATVVLAGSFEITVLRTGGDS
jgi:hypothetical protein